MPRVAKPLKPTACNALKSKADGGKGRLYDGDGLYLEALSSGSGQLRKVTRKWRFAYRRPSGGETRMTFGTYPGIELANARKMRQEARALLDQGIDPQAHKKAQSNAVASRAQNCFEHHAKDWLEAKRVEWTPTYHEKVKGRLDNHVFPWIGSKDISELDTDDINPILQRKVNANQIDSAHRICNYMSEIFVRAIALNRTKTDPAGALRRILPKHSKTAYKTIVDPDEIGEMLIRIDGYTGRFQTVCALKLAPLWFCRPGELRSAEWDHLQLDGDKKEYWVPPENRKLDKKSKEDINAASHIIPLSRQALEILEELRPLTGHRRFVFPSTANPATQCMSDNTCRRALKALDCEIVPHGFRHMAKTRLEEMGFDSKVIEAQLSHKIKGIEGTYWRQQYLRQREARHEMMQAWADYLDGLRTKVKKSN